MIPRKPRLRQGSHWSPQSFWDQRAISERLQGARLGPIPVRQQVKVHQLEDDRRGTGDGNLTLLPSADGPNIADTQHRGQLRLGEAVALADGGDFSGAHHRSVEHAAVGAVKLHLEDGAETVGQPILDLPEAAERVEDHILAGADRNIGRQGEVEGHFAFSLVRWGTAPFDEALMRAKCPIGNRENAGYVNYFRANTRLQGSRHNLTPPRPCGFRDRDA